MRVGHFRLGQGIGLDELDEESIEIPDQHGASLSRVANSERRDARRDYRCSRLFRRSQLRVNVADREHQGRGAGILVSGSGPFPVEAGEFNQLQIEASVRNLEREVTELGVVRRGQAT